MQNPLNTHPTLTIKGTASIKQYHILNDKRYIVTKDTDDNVCVWDVLQARKSESLGKENYENAIKIRQRFISIPNWFTVDLKLGVLTINLDESDWQSAWINFKDMDSNHVRQTQNIDLSDAKVNYGCIFLESLFKSCLFINPHQMQTCSTVIVSSSTNSSAQSNTNKEDEQNQAGLLRFSIPDHITIIFSEVAGRTLHRIEVRDMARESEQQTLSNVIPNWIIDALLGVSLFKFFFVMVKLLLILVCNFRKRFRNLIG
jgi:WD repeat-containing protein 48